MMKRKAWLMGALLCAAGSVMILMGWGIYRQPASPPGNPFARMGTSWRPEKIDQIRERGLSHFSIAGQASPVVRVYEQGSVTVMEKGTIGRVQAETVQGITGSPGFRRNGVPWGEKGPCLVWQFHGLQLDMNDDFGGIELTITDRRKKENNFHISFLSRTATVPLTSGESMSYVILPDMATVPNNIRGLENRNSLDVVFPHVSDRNEVELHSLRILSKAASFADDATGQAYETLDDETRPVVYQWTDGLLSWDVEVPGNSPVLKFGTGLLSRSGTVTFSLSLVLEGSETELFRKAVGHGGVWADHSLDLSPWKNRQVSIRFRANAPAPAIALWSTPRIVQSGHRGKLFCLYVVDALRADACEGFETFGSPVNDTPAIRALSRTGVTFTNALANAPITKYSLSSLFTGLYPSHNGIMQYQRIPDALQTLPELLRQNGFTTASFILNSNAGRMRGLHQGFDYLFDTEKLFREARNLQAGDTEDIYRSYPASTSAGVMNDFLFSFIRRHREEDMFVYLHLMDTHAPYLPDEEFLGQFYDLMGQKGIPVPADRSVLLDELKLTQRPNYSPEEHLSEEVLLALYRYAARTADKHLQRFIEYLRSEGREDNTTLIFTADHGEHLNQHPDLLRFTHMHPMLLEVLRIPLVVYAPAILHPGVVVDTPVQLADVMPTLLDLAGISYQPSRYDGVSLLSLAAGLDDEYFSGRPIVSQSSPHWSVLLGDMHCPDITRGYNAMVYNIGSDPREHTPLQVGPAMKALDALVASLAMIPQREVPGEDTIITNENALQQLKDLGYIQ